MRHWAELHFGFMGRTPDYKSGLAVSLGANPGFFGPYESNCDHWYERLSDDVLFMNHIGVNPMVDRSKRPHELPAQLAAEMYVKGADRNALEYRRWLYEIANGRVQMAETKDPIPAQGRSDRS